MYNIHMNIDTLLLEIEKAGFQNLSKSVPGKDIKILKNLCSSILGPNYITENQSRLLVKILKENAQHLPVDVTIVELALTHPTWAKAFRQVDQTKKLFIGKDTQGDLTLVLEVAFNANLKKILKNLGSECEGNLVTSNGRMFLTDLTEKNIVLLVDALIPEGFEIDRTIIDHYNTIKSWKIEEIQSRYFTENLIDTNLYKSLVTDIGELATADIDIIQDRSVRYQYNINTPKNTEKTLKHQLIFRTGPKVWIDSNATALQEVFAELQAINRFPLLLVIESHVQPKALEFLKTIDSALQDCNITDRVGVYFRLDNDPIGKEFNTLIAERKYNTVLDDSTKIACVSNGKIPKFFLKSAWKPKAVISIGTTLRHSKTSVYANCCDLIVSYHHTESLMEFRPNLCP
jgi:hypothetical protein